MNCIGLLPLSICSKLKFLNQHVTCMKIKPNILPKRNYAGKITRQANNILVRQEVLHRNRCFDGIAPSLAAAMAQAEEEKRAWELAGAKGISFLVAQVPGA
jgi:hypothetical protein